MTTLKAEEVRPYWEAVAQRELGETSEVKEKCLAELRVLINEDSLLQCPTDDAFLVKFLRGRKYRVNDAFNNIRTHFRMRRDHPELFRERPPDALNYDLLVRKHRLIIVLKERDTLGRAVACMRIGAWDISICTITELIRAAIVFTECSLIDEETQVNGMIGLIDYKGFQLHHFRHLVPFLRTAIHLTQDCFPMRIKGIYGLNCPPIFEVFFALMKPFLKSKVLDRIHILRDDHKKLHEVLSPDVLPREFGGTRDDYDVDSLEASLLSKRGYFENIEKYGYST